MAPAPTSPITRVLRLSKMFKGFLSERRIGQPGVAVIQVFQVPVTES